MSITLADVWFGIIGFLLLLALALDGFDLGVGILSLLGREETRRTEMMNSIGPFWHANLTWLVVAGGLLFGAFPLAYAVVFSALYLPVILMIFGLIFRGVAFDFRAEARGRGGWGLAFGAGSLLAALAQGFVAGGFCCGFQMAGGQFAGGLWDWLNPFAALVALGLLSAYVLLGATYLIMKTSGPLQEDCYRYAQAAAWVTLVLAAAVGLWALKKNPFLTRHWFTFPGFWVTVCPVLLGIVAFALLIYSLLRLKETAPFGWSLALFACLALALAASLYPYVIPPEITLAEAAAPAGTLMVMLAVIIVALPLMLLYNGYQYRVFRGKSAGGYGEE